MVEYGDAVDPLGLTTKQKRAARKGLLRYFGGPFDSLADSFAQGDMD